MKRLMIVLVLFSCFFMAAAQHVKNVVHDSNAEIRQVGSFNGVTVSGAVNVYISQGSENAVAISTEGGENAKIKTEVRDGILRISPESGTWSFWNWGNERKIKAYVTVKDLKRLEASGASKIFITDRITVSNIKIEITGASSIKGEIAAETIKMEVSGASNGILSGTADNLNIEVTGASTFRAMDLVTNTCSAEASGASSIRVNVQKEFLLADASGASTIHYKGSPLIRNFDSSGASSIKKDDN